MTLTKMIADIRWFHYLRNGRWDYLNQPAQVLLMTNEGAALWWVHKQ